MDARSTAHGDEESILTSSQALFRVRLTNCPNSNSQVPESQEYNEAIAAAGCATKMLVNFPRDRSRLLALLSGGLGWQSWNDDEEDWTRSATRIFFDSYGVQGCFFFEFF